MTALTGTRWFLIGSNGTTFDLSTGSAGVHLGPNLSGVHHVPTTHVWRQTAGQVGRTHVGVNRDARELDLRLLITGPDAAARRATDAALWDALSFTDPARLIAVSTSTGYRYTDVLLAEDPLLVFTRDPVLDDCFDYAVTLIAPDPWAKMLTQSTGPVPYPQWSGITLRNPGLPVSAVWFFDGAGQHTMGFPGDTVTLPAQTAGHTVQVDTNPLAPTITSGGVSLWSQMGQQRLGALIPPGDTVPVLTSVGATASTTVTVTFTPITERFW